MILRFDEIDSDKVFETDLCIVGAGAAGITLAREFAGTSIDVIVVESGRLQVDDRFEQLNEGEVADTPFTGLRAGRRRGLGGTTAAWGGQCCELDEHDFLPRPWIAHSGWPFDRQTLEPYYRRAEQVFAVDGERYDEAIWRRWHIEPVRYEPALLHNAFSVFSPKPRIGKVYRKLIAEARNVRVIVGATATNIRTNANASKAIGLDVRDLDGRQAVISAGTLVLCTGTIETARLMLASRDVEAHGVGNRHGLVGRYFQDHPTSYTATILPSNRRRIQDVYGVLFRGRTWYWPKIALAPDLQRHAGVLNGGACAMFEYDSSALTVLRDMVRTTRTGGRFKPSGSDISALLRGAGPVFDAAIRRYVLGRSPRSRPSRVDLMCTIEQSPNPDSRVTLSESPDGLGVPTVRVEWKIGDIERETFRVLTNTIGTEFRRLGLGDVIAEPWLSSNERSDWKFWDNFHQLGTTRMSVDPSNGVVDADCRVHGVDGLFVAGAPTFPAGGYVNPVLTITALTIRLADHLKRRLHESGTSRP